MTKMALKDALLPREIVALTTLPQSGFVQQPISDNVGGVKVFFEHTALCTLKRAPFRSN